MPVDTLTLSTAGAALAAALVAGVFLAFSDFIMRALCDTGGGAGMAAMQAINRTVYRSVFMVLLIGMVPVAAAIAALAWSGPAAPLPATGWIIAGAALYAVGVMGVTLVCNVPMNHRLDALDQHAAGSHADWHTYCARWTRWNHVRTLAASGSAACFLVAAINRA